MRSIPARCFTTGLILAAALAAAEAQGPPGGMPFPMGGPGPGGPSLITSPPIQDDLELTDKQKAQLKGLQSSMMQQMREGMEQAREGGVEPQEMMEGMTALRKEHEGKVAKVLSKEQKARLAQIELQREGLMAAARSDVATKLKLTAAQSRKVRSIVDESRQAAFQGMFPPPGAGGFPGGLPNGGLPNGGGQPGEGQPGIPPGGGFPGAGGFPGGAPGGMPNFNSPEFQAQIKKMTEDQKKSRDSANTKVAEVLTPEQKTAFEKMLGKPFDFAKITPGPPPGVPGAADELKIDNAAIKADPGTMKKDATKAKGKTRKN